MRCQTIRNEYSRETIIPLAKSRASFLFISAESSGWQDISHMSAGVFLKAFQIKTAARASDGTARAFDLFDDVGE